MNIKDVLDVKWPKSGRKDDEKRDLKEIPEAEVTSLLPWVTSSTLPLLYMNLSSSRLFVPISRDLVGGLSLVDRDGDRSRDRESRDASRDHHVETTLDHDVYLLQMSSIQVSSLISVIHFYP